MKARKSAHPHTVTEERGILRAFVPDQHANTNGRHPRAQSHHEFIASVMKCKPLLCELLLLNSAGFAVRCSRPSFSARSFRMRGTAIFAAILPASMASSAR